MSPMLPPLPPPPLPPLRPRTLGVAAKEPEGEDTGNLRFLLENVSKYERACVRAPRPGCAFSETLERQCKVEMCHEVVHDGPAGAAQELLNQMSVLLFNCISD